jgi:3-hydroxyisobutyrate dehydrogenase
MDVTVLGTGMMGGPMARNLAKAGHRVTVWNRTAEKAQALAGEVARVAGDPEDAVRGAQVVVTMLADGAAVEAATPVEAISGTWWQASTIGLVATERLAERAADARVTYVDGPVLGTRQPAEEGKLVVLASGPGAALDQLDPLFGAVGSKAVRLGEEVGSATRLKLVLNHWLVGLVETLAETIAFAEGLGVDPRQFLQTIEGGGLDSPYAQLKGRMMIERALEPSFTLRLAAKDVDLVLEAAAREGIDLALAPAVRERFRRAIDAGHGDEDLAAAIYGSLPAG